MPRASQVPDLESGVEVGESETGSAAWRVIPYPPAPALFFQAVLVAASVSPCSPQAVTKVGAPARGIFSRMQIPGVGALSGEEILKGMGGR